MSVEHLIHTLLIWGIAAGLAGLNAVVVGGLMLLLERRHRARCFVSGYHGDLVCGQGTRGCVVDHGSGHG